MQRSGHPPRRVPDERATGVDRCGRISRGEPAAPFPPVRASGRVRRRGCRAQADQPALRVGEVGPPAHVAADLLARRLDRAAVGGDGVERRLDVGDVDVDPDAVGPPRLGRRRGHRSWRRRRTPRRSPRRTAGRSSRTRRSRTVLAFSRSWTGISHQVTVLSPGAAAVVGHRGPFCRCVGTVPTTRMTIRRPPHRQRPPAPSGRIRRAADGGASGPITLRSRSRRSLSVVAPSVSTMVACSSNATWRPASSSRRCLRRSRSGRRRDGRWRCGAARPDPRPRARRRSRARPAPTPPTSRRAAAASRAGRT